MKGAYNSCRNPGECPSPRTSTVAQALNDAALKHRIKSELARLTEAITEAMATGGGALVVVRLQTSPPGVRGASLHARWSQPTQLTFRRVSLGNEPSKCMRLSLLLG